MKLRVWFRMKLGALKAGLERRAIIWLRSRGLYVLRCDKIDCTFNEMVAQRQFLNKSGHLLNGKSGRVPQARRKLLMGNDRALAALIEATKLDGRPAQEIR